MKRSNVIFVQRKLHEMSFCFFLQGLVPTLSALLIRFMLVVFIQNFPQHFLLLAVLRITFLLFLVFFDILLQFFQDIN